MHPDTQRRIEQDEREIEELQLQAALRTSRREAELSGSARACAWPRAASRPVTAAYRGGIVTIAPGEKYYVDADGARRYLVEGQGW